MSSPASLEECLKHMQDRLRTVTAEKIAIEADIAAVSSVVDRYGSLGDSGKAGNGHRDAQKKATVGNGHLSPPINNKPLAANTSNGAATASSGVAHSNGSAAGDPSKNKKPITYERGYPFMRLNARCRIGGVYSVQQVESIVYGNDPVDGHSNGAKICGNMVDRGSMKWATFGCYEWLGDPPNGTKRKRGKQRYGAKV